MLTGGSGLEERKRALAERSDCFIALPGGPGTWDELWDIAAARQLGVGAYGPVCLVNTDGYYSGFVEQLRRAHADKLLHKSPDEFLFVAPDPHSAIDWCETHVGKATVLADTVIKSAAEAEPSLFEHRHTSVALSGLMGVAVGALAAMLLLRR